MKLIDSFLNRITMYRLMLYFLIALVSVAFLLSSFRMLPYNPLDIAINCLLAIIVCLITNYVFAKLFRAVTNVESVYITALILVLIIPARYPDSIPVIAIASTLAMATKYLLTINKQHVFNPAAVSVAMISLLSPQHSATWWVGTPVMMPFILAGGLLLVRKIKRETLVFTFLFSFLLLVAAASFLRNGSLMAATDTWQQSMLYSSLFYFTFVMLTEPMTSPTTEKKQQYFALFTAVLYATPQLRLFSFTLTPEMALCLGNVFSYFISPSYRLILPMKWKKEIAKDTYLFSFRNTNGFTFKPGQYMEWTLPHRNPDNRGNRRYFSLASSPTEKNPMIAIRFYEPPSSYKKELLSLQSGKPIIASQLAGDFTLPKNLNQPLVFVAGGIGITPFRSMIRYIIDKKITCEIVIMYSNRQMDDIAFANELAEVRKYGVRTIYTLTDINHVPPGWKGKTGYITTDMIAEEIPDYKKRIFYLSGPKKMIDSFKKTLSGMKIPRHQIKTDFFPGYNEQ